MMKIYFLTFILSVIIFTGFSQKKPVKFENYTCHATPYYQKLYLDTFNLFHKVDSLIHVESLNFWPEFQVSFYLTVRYKFKTFDTIQINGFETVVNISKPDNYSSRQEFVFLDTIKTANAFELNSLVLNLNEHALVYEKPDPKSKILVQREETDEVSNLELLAEKPMIKDKNKFVKVKFIYYNSKEQKPNEEVEGWILYKDLYRGYSPDAIQY